MLAGWAGGSGEAWALPGVSVTPEVLASGGAGAAVAPDSATDGEYLTPDPWKGWLSCQEEMVQVRQDKVPARDADWGAVRGKVEVAWAVRFRPARAGFAYVRNAPTKRPTSPDNPAFRERAPSAVHR